MRVTHSVWHRIGFYHNSVWMHSGDGSEKECREIATAQRKTLPMFQRRIAEFLVLPIGEFPLLCNGKSEVPPG